MLNNGNEQNNRYYEEQPQTYTVWVPRTPYTDAYLGARRGGGMEPSNRYSEQRPQQQSRPQYQQPNNGKKQSNVKQKKIKPIKDYALRKPIMWIITVFMLLAIVANVLPVFGVLGEYTAPFIRRNTALSDKYVEQVQYTSIADPVMSLVVYLTKGVPEEGKEIVEDAKAMPSERFYYDCLSQIDKYKADEAKEQAGDIVKVIAYYAMPIIAILFVILTVYILIKALSTAVSGKKRNFAYSLLLGILFLAAMAILTAMWNNLGMSEIGKVFLSPINILSKGDKISSGDIASKAALGLGFYVTFVLYFLGWILNIFAYKVTKRDPMMY